MPRISLILVSLCLFLSLANSSVAGNSEDITVEGDSRAMDELLLFFEEEELIITATKHPQKISDAPAIATIITAEEVRNMGARDLMDVLNRIPGVHITKGYYGKEEIEVRGIKTTNSEKVKLLIDGHSVNDNASGGAVWSFDSLTVDNVKRIEVIRGPGSALYGSNAFSAVINVVTKNGNDIDGVIVTLGGGTFDTGKFNIQAGKKRDDLDIALSLDYFETDGARLKVDSDAIGNSGYTKDYEEKFDAAFKIAYKDFYFNSKYISRKRGAYIGASYVVTDENEIDTDQYFGEFGYKHTVNEETKVTAKAYLDRLDWDAYWELLPEGVGPYTEGMIGNPSLKERTIGGDMQIDYTLSEDNLLTIGALKEERKQYDVRHKANFDPTTCGPSGCAPVGPIQTVANWNQEKRRDIWAVYLQDVWDVKENINLTLGVRYDDYSDFGSTTNPKAGLVWKFKEGWDAKFLYGTAFRAPSFEELYNENNPTVLGNKDLDAEEMTTYELSLGHKYSDHTSARITYFQNNFENKIELVSGQFQNTGGADVWGIETEWKRVVSDTTSTYLNYTYQNAEDKDSGKRIAGVASHKGNVGLNLKATDNINLNTNIFLSGNRRRASGDSRSSATSYALIDLAVIVKELYNNMEIRGSIHNLLDKEYEDPSPNGTVPGDFPKEGRHLMIEASYKF